ncbi:ATP-binding protein [Parabacteroides faecis]|nr:MULTISPECIES: ATP-binding protein [Parabacteroides]MBC8618510.1 ATP-binding protein [Parabacteroides faecis]RHR94782.1 AAA family ATPase [Parabacteroides sp. AF14-59]
MMAKLYPIGIQNFESLREDGYIYVDKTELVYQLVKTGRYYLLNRPRRFGKSLLISTLEAYFLGKKELFKDLAIEKLEKDWLEYPVLHLDLNAEKFDSPERLDALLSNQLTQWEELYGHGPDETTLSLRFKGVIRRAARQTGQRVVILIDEYDKPMLQALENDELQEKFRDTLMAFYGVMKSMDGDIKFAFLTGVTKFGKVSAFSDLNNLMDISMDDRNANICGITEPEIHAYFKDDLHELARVQNMDYDQVCIALREFYDGYHFTENLKGIYNPFSLLNTFKYLQFGSYWFETGTPTYLVKLLKHSHYNLYNMAHTETDADVLNSIDSTSVNPIPVIYQSGYLTIKGYDREFGIYRLGFPNREVEEGFMKYLLPFYANTDKVDSSFHIQKFVREIRSGNYDSFFRRLQSLFADTPYELVRDLELHYQNVLFIVFKLIGFYVKAEYHTSEGRIDLVLQTDRFIYLMEFKLNGTADDALRQINEKGYALPFAADPRQLFKIGVNFSAKTRNIEEWKIESK